MMVISGLNMEAYEEFMIEVSYAKLVPFIMKDFISRTDAKQMMSSSNLIVNTDVLTLPTACQVAFPAGTGITAPGKGNGVGKVTAIYTGTQKLPQDELLLTKAKAIVVGGGAASDALTELG